MKIKVLGIVFSILALSACGERHMTQDRPIDAVVRGVSYVGVSVSDLDKSSEFYSSAADLRETGRAVLENSSALDGIAGSSGIRVDTRLLRSVNAQLRFMKFEDSATAAEVPVQGPGIAHVCFQVAKTTRAYERFLENGARPIGEREMVQLNSRSPVEYAYARDHDGILFEVEHVDVAAMKLKDPPKSDYRIRHVSLATPDIERLVSFYSVLLEVSNPRRVNRVSSPKMDKVAGLKNVTVSMAWYQIKNLELEIFQYKSHPTETPKTPRPVTALGYNMIVLDVTDIEGAKDLIVAGGGTVVSEPQPLDDGQILFARDPDGNLLGLQTIRPDSVLSSEQFEDAGI